jgi:hypothetical protein
VTAITGTRETTAPLALPLRPLGVVAALLVAMDAVLRLTYWGRHRRDTALVWFDTTAEGSIPTCFTVALTLAIGLVCLRRSGPGRRWWRVTGSLFSYLAIDDMLSLHERFGALVHPWLEGRGVYAWILTLAPVLAILGIACASFLLRVLRDLPRQRRFLWLGFASLAGALVLEGFESAAGTSGIRLRGIPLLCYAQWLEESLEVLGPLFVLAAVWPAPPPQAAPGQVLFIGAGR